MGVCSTAPPRSRIDSSGTHRTRGQGGWRTATPIANHPPHTGNQSRNPGQGHHFTHPGKPVSSLPCCVVHAELSPPAEPRPPANAGPLGFLGHLDGIGLKIENVGHDLSPPLMVFGVWIWVAHPPSLVVVGGGELVTRHDPDEVACFRAKL